MSKPEKEKKDLPAGRQGGDLDREYAEFFEEAEEICQACGAPLKAEKVNLEELEDGKLYLMENVPAYVCDGCGEMWVPEPVLKEFEKMMDTAKKHKSKLRKKA